MAILYEEIEEFLRWTTTKNRMISYRFRRNKFYCAC